MRGPAKIILYIVMASGLSALRCGGAVYHSNGTPSNIQSIHDNQAHNGDTITLPSGTFTWASGVTITKAITLEGQGVGATIVKDNVQSGPFLRWTLAAGQPARMTGIEFQDGGRTASSEGILLIRGSNTDGSTFRWDHCKVNELNGCPNINTVIGVIDHVTFVVASKFHTGIYIYGSSWNNQSSGDGSWAAPINYGSSQFVFIEDCEFINNAGGVSPLTDAYAGARFVVRHCTIHDGLVANHGTESTGRRRGGRAIEVYNNRFIGTNRNTAIAGIRSGGLLIHDNTISGYLGNNASTTLSNYRNVYPFNPWGGADGTNAWDANDPTVFFTGTAASASSCANSCTVTVSGANWATDQWAGYTIRRTSTSCNHGAPAFGWIRSNTSNAITYASGAFDDLQFCTGDSLQIRKVNHSLDQPGRGQGSLVSDTNPTPPPGWNNQVTEPCYSWNNTNELGGHVNFNRNSGTIRLNEHYFNNTAMPGYTPYTYPHPLVIGAGRAVVGDFNGDGRPDFVLQRADTHQTAIWYLNNNVFVGSDSGPTLPGAWSLVGGADFNSDGHPDYALFHSSNRQTVMGYLSGPTVIGAAYGPALPGGWELATVGDFNGDRHPDYVVYKARTHQTAIGYLNNNILTGAAFGPPLPAARSLIGVADFDRDGHPDYALFVSRTGQTVIGYLSGVTVRGAALGPTVPSGWALVATADFNADAYPDYLLYNAATRQTAIWYLNNNVYIGSAPGPTLPAGWSLLGP